MNITNAGELGADPFGPNSGTTGNICANVYVFSPDQEEIACCTCLVTPNALVHLSAAKDLVSNTSSGVPPVTNSIVVKLLATIPGTGTTPGVQSTGPFTGTVCNAAYPCGVTNLAPDMRAWAPKLHSTVPASPNSPPFLLTEGRFLTNPIDLTSINALTVQEITSITNRCRFIKGNQSGAGLCKACTLGGLGAAHN